MFTVAKVDGVLLFEDRGGYQSRNESTIWCIEEADRVHDLGDFDASYLAEGVAPHAAPFLVITPSAAAVVGDVYVYA